VDDELLLDAPVTVGIAPEDADPDELIGRAGASVVDVPLAFEWTIQA
jgi:hypothetical protein